MLAITEISYFLLYRRQLGGSFESKRLPSASEAVKHRGYFSYTCTVLVLVALASWWWPHAGTQVDWTCGTLRPGSRTLPGLAGVLAYQRWL